MADGTTPIVPPTPTAAVTPGGINHLVINVRDIEESHYRATMDQLVDRNTMAEENTWRRENRG